MHFARKQKSLLIGLNTSMVTTLVELNKQYFLFGSPGIIYEVVMAKTVSLPSWGSLKIERVKYCHESRGTRTQTDSAGEAQQQPYITDPPSRQGGVPY
jgi:hypothetical protein